MTAEKIEIYPDDHMVAYNAKFLIKGQVIYQTDEYSTKIGTNSDGKNQWIPLRIRINDDDGLSIGYKLDAPLMDNVSLC